MAFSYTVTAAYTTGKLKSAQGNEKPALIHYEGTWTMGGDTKGSIDLTNTTKANVNIAAVKIYRWDFAINTGTVTTCPKAKPDVDLDGVAKLGCIGLLVVPNDNIGTFWADVVQ